MRSSCNRTVKCKAQRIHNIILFFLLHFIVFSSSKWFQSYFKCTSEASQLKETINYLSAFNTLAKFSYWADKDKAKMNISANTDIVVDILCIPILQIEKIKLFKVRKQTIALCLWSTKWIFRNSLIQSKSCF